MASKLGSKKTTTTTTVDDGDDGDAAETTTTTTTTITSNNSSNSFSLFNPCARAAACKPEEVEADLRAAAKTTNGLLIVVERERERD